MSPSTNAPNNSDSEAHFWLNEYINETSLHFQKAIIWCAICVEGIIDPKKTLTPLGVYVKSIVYSEKPETFDALQKVVENWAFRLEFEPATISSLLQGN